MIAFKSRLDLLFNAYKSRYNLSDDETERQLNYILKNKFESKFDIFMKHIDDIYDRKYEFKQG